MLKLLIVYKILLDQEEPELVLINGNQKSLTLVSYKDFKIIRYKLLHRINN